MNEKELTDSASGAVCYEEEITMACKREEANEAAAAAAKKHLNPMMRSQRKMWTLEDLSRREEAHPKERNNDWKIWEKKKTRGDSTNTRRLQKGSGTFQESRLQEEEYSSPRQRTRKAKSLHQGRELPMSSGNSTKKLYDDQEHEETEQEHEENETESSIDVQNKDTSEMKRIPEITIWRVTDCNQQTQKICRQQWNQSRRHQS